MEKLPKLTKKQKGFVKDYLETGNGTFAAKKNYNIGGKGGSSESTASVIAVENLAKPNVQAYLEDKAQMASEIVVEIAQHGETDSVRLSASKDILDRAGYQPIAKTLNVDVQLNIENKQHVEDIAKKVIAQMKQDETI